MHFCSTHILPHTGKPSSQALYLLSCHTEWSSIYDEEKVTCQQQVTFSLNIDMQFLSLSVQPAPAGFYAKVLLQQVHLLIGDGVFEGQMGDFHIYLGCFFRRFDKAECLI